MPKAAKPTTQRIFIAGQLALLSGVIAAAAATSHTQDWTPLPLLFLLLVLGALGEWLTVTVGIQHLSAGFIALVLAATLLGPAPAVAIGIVAVTFDLVHRRPPLRAWSSNLLAYATYLLASGLLARLLVGNVHSPADAHLIRSPIFALVVFGVFVVAMVLNFLLIALNKRVFDGSRMLTQARTLLIPMLPGQLAAAIVAALLALAYTNLGYAALVAIVIAIVIFQYLTVALMRSEDRAEQLQARSVHLASLLHDVGKFALPDRILHAEILSETDWAAIRRHPQDGATLVGRLDGYGPVADIILYHHEQVDGGGYPAGLIGNEIPLLARMLAVANVYDTLTARGGYCTPMTPQDALTELRRVAGRQLDEDLVQRFAALAEREGPEEFTKRGQEADFERELAFERRTRALATPAAA